jgi:hypothetical protein
LLPYLLLLAVYYSHLNTAFLPPFQEDPRVGPLAIGTDPEKVFPSRIKVQSLFRHPAEDGLNL